jgi:peptidylprolyl isomerase
MHRKRLAAAAAFALSLPLAAQEPAPSPADIVNAAPQDDWVVIPPEDLVVMTLAPDAEGNAREVVIQLMPPPFSQGWVENIRLLARERWYDGTSVNRVQDNYVVQWGDPNYDNPEADGKAKPLPEGLKVMGEDEYVDVTRSAGPDEDTITLWHPKPDLVDSYADSATFDKGWPLGIEIGEGTRVLRRWPVHCYGMVGVGRN